MGAKEKCPTCGTTTLHFDPPIELEVADACGQMKPGTYTGSQPGGIPVCQSTKGHDGKHAYLVEYVDSWGD